jgi:hypothetical protein
MFLRARSTQSPSTFLLLCLQVAVRPKGSFSAIAEARSTDHPFESVELGESQSASSESEVSWNAQNPTVIGLFSLLIGTDDLEEIQTFIRRLRELGNAFLVAKPPINYERILE